MNRAEPKKIRELDTPSIEVAKVTIKDYFDQRYGEIVDYVALVNAFDLPLPLIVEAWEQLEAEGRIAGVDCEERRSIAL